MSKSPANLIWIDLEMTGLYPEKDKIIEIATLVTDSDLNIVAEGPVFAVHQSDDLLNGMDEWCTKQHNESGLVKRVRESTVNDREAEEKTIAFLNEYSEAGWSPMCGNSIWQDRRFLTKYMPNLADYFHYRMIDVSTLKELAKRWAPEVAAGVKKDSRHLAMDDICDSVNELIYYRKYFIKSA